jgi:flagellar biosynthesis anti-sigma factor FlgM
LRIYENIAPTLNVDQGTKRPEAQPQTAPPTDEASISAVAQALSQPDPARQAKIQALKQAIESGTYRVDPEKVAQAMIREFVMPADSGE